MLASRSWSSSSSDSLQLLLVAGFAQHQAQESPRPARRPPPPGDRTARRTWPAARRADGRSTRSGRHGGPPPAAAGRAARRSRRAGRCVVLPMPRGGVLITRSKATSSLRIVQQVQVGQDVLDFLALEELQAVDHLVGHAQLAQGELERPAQGVDAVEDGEIARPAAAAVDVGGDPGGDPVGLVLLRGVGRQPHRRARPVLGEQALLLAADVVGDQLGGHAQDPLRAAVVLLQPDDVDLGKVPLELQDVVQVRAAPAVDRLVRVAGHRQVRMVDRQRPGDGVLGQVGVLVLVDQDEAVALVEARRGPRGCRAGGWPRAAAGRRNRRRSRRPAGAGRPGRPRWTTLPRAWPGRGWYWSGVIRLFLAQLMALAMASGVKRSTSIFSRPMAWRRARTLSPAS